MALKCLKCILSQPSVHGEYLINCQNCLKAHLISNISELPTSHVTLRLIEKLAETSEYSSLSDLKAILKEYSSDLSAQIRIEKFEVYKFYDNVINDIDIRAEELLQSVHLSRDQLQNQIKVYQNEALKFFNDTNVDSSTANANNNMVLKMLDVKNKLTFLSSNTVDVDKETLDSIVKDSNILQQYLFDLHDKWWYFTEYPHKFDQSLLGKNLNCDFDQNFIKIKHLAEFLADPVRSTRIHLAVEFAQETIQQIILPLEKIIKVYFTTFKGLQIETFDTATGALIKK